MFGSIRNIKNLTLKGGSSRERNAVGYTVLKHSNKDKGKVVPGLN
jgi:hypothetical protein